MLENYFIVIAKAISPSEAAIPPSAFSIPSRSNPDNSAFAEPIIFKLNVLISIKAKIAVNNMFVYFVNYPFNYQNILFDI